MIAPGFTCSMRNNSLAPLLQVTAQPQPLSDAASCSGSQYTTEGSGCTVVPSRVDEQPVPSSRD
jgi:hypothetical protein